MISIPIPLLKLLHKAYSYSFGNSSLRQLPSENNADVAAAYISELLTGDNPCMIARLGSTELAAMVNYKGVIMPQKSIFGYITGRQPEWWWSDWVANQMRDWSGFFPSTPEYLRKFGDRMMQDLAQLDLLGSWVPQEAWFAEELSSVKRVHLRLLEPFWAKTPWSQCLAEKRIVVIHPFADVIESQYKNNREKLFVNPHILPQFASLRIIKAVQSLGGQSHGFADWFEALDWMAAELDKDDYDIALIGCGAYGFPLAAHVKRSGKKAVHMGGALQLLFGIRGARWEDPEYGVKEWNIPSGSYCNLMNEYWVRPGATGRAKNANQIEGGCYW